MFRRAAALPLLVLLAACHALPAGRAPERVPSGPISRPVTPPEPTREARRCLAELAENQTRFTVQPDAYYGAGCSTINTVRIEGLSGDAANIAVTNLGAVTCPLARTFSGCARAEAIDVAAFVLADGRRISVLEDWNAGDAEEREFLQTVQRSACKRFGTVLGPDYNAAHANHFHLEEGSGSFCR